ncbi:hypothetical protein [Mangrovimonas cancribranchiae]|uniref:Uncharacterized protein n=1 Tax=Mangrovimonas cancribranchiae TaxID=3080055 RepID=A0AAU6NWI3_9FLAO
MNINNKQTIMDLKLKISVSPSETPLSKNQVQLINELYNVVKDKNLKDSKRALMLLCENLDAKSTIN